MEYITSSHGVIAVKGPILVGFRQKMCHGSDEIELFLSYMDAIGAPKMGVLFLTIMEKKSGMGHDAPFLKSMIISFASKEPGKYIYPNLMYRSNIYSTLIKS